MSKARTILVLLLAILSASALLVCTASANWIVEGKELGVGSKAALATTARVDVPPTCARRERAGQSTVRISASGQEEENTSQLIEGLGSTANNSLEVVGKRAFLEDGNAKLKLATAGGFADGSGFVRIEPRLAVHLGSWKKRKLQPAALYSYKY